MFLMVICLLFFILVKITNLNKVCPCGAFIYRNRIINQKQWPPQGIRHRLGELWWGPDSSQCPPGLLCTRCHRALVLTWRGMLLTWHGCRTWSARCGALSLVIKPNLEPNSHRLVNKWIFWAILQPQLSKNVKKLLFCGKFYLR